MLISCSKLYSSWIHGIESNLGHLTDYLLQRLQLILCNWLPNLFQTPTQKCTPTLLSHAARARERLRTFSVLFLLDSQHVFDFLVHWSQNKHINQDIKTQVTSGQNLGFPPVSQLALSDRNLSVAKQSLVQCVLQCYELKVIQTSITQLDVWQKKPKQINLISRQIKLVKVFWSKNCSSPNLIFPRSSPVPCDEYPVIIQCYQGFYLQ